MRYSKSTLKNEDNLTDIHYVVEMKNNLIDSIKNEDNLIDTHFVVEMKDNLINTIKIKYCLNY